MNVDGDIVDGGCNVEVLSDGVMREEGVVRKVDEVDGVMNGGDESCATRMNRTVLPDSGVDWEGVDGRFLVDLSLDYGIHAMRIFSG